MCILRSMPRGIGDEIGSFRGWLKRYLREGQTCFVLHRYMNEQKALQYISYRLSAMHQSVVLQIWSLSAQSSLFIFLSNGYTICSCTNQLWNQKILCQCYAKKILWLSHRLLHVFGERHTTCSPPSHLQRAIRSLELHSLSFFVSDFLGSASWHGKKVRQNKNRINQHNYYS